MAATLVRTVPVYTSSPASSRSGSVRPRATTRPPWMGTTSVVVVPMSTSSASVRWRVTSTAVAIQLEAATARGRARASASFTKTPSVVNTASRPRATAPIASRMKVTPSRFVRNTSDSSAVIVTAVASASGRSAATARRTSARPVGSFQISNGRLTVSTEVASPSRRTWAAFTLAPPMAEPLALARAFVDRLGARECYVADLDAIAGVGDHGPVIRALASLGLDVWLDAGTATAAEVEQARDVGAARVIVGTETLRDPGDLAGMARTREGSPAPACVLSLDLRDGRLLGGSPEVARLGPAGLSAMAWEAGIRAFI